MADKGGIRMILADKITEERKKNGWSQEELADKLGVSRQAVSKWESAGSTPDLQRVIQLAQLFDVSTDYLLRDEVVRQEETIRPDIEIETKDKGSVRRVSMEEANSFLDLKRKSAPEIANAIFLCVISPSLLILFSMMTESMVLPISETTGEAIGMLFLFLTIAPAVFIFITNGLREKSMEYLEQESFSTARWDFTWIIWPVAGVLFGAISGIVRLKEGTEN